MRIGSNHISELIALASKFYQVQEDYIADKNKSTGDVTIARYSCMYVMHKKWGITQSSVADKFGYTGDTKHTFVTYGCKKINERLSVEKEFTKRFELFLEYAEAIVPNVENKIDGIYKLIEQENKFEKELQTLEKKIEAWKKLREEIMQDVNRLTDL